MSDVTPPTAEELVKMTDQQLIDRYGELTAEMERQRKLAEGQSLTVAKMLLRLHPSQVAKALGVERRIVDFHSSEVEVLIQREMKYSHQPRAVCIDRLLEDRRP